MFAQVLSVTLLRKVMSCKDWVPIPSSTTREHDLETATTNSWSDMYNVMEGCDGDTEDDSVRDSCTVDSLQDALKIVRY
jgi:hypothetical protein